MFDPGYTEVCVTRVVTAVTGSGNLDLCSFHDSFGLVVMRAKGRRRGLFLVLGRLVRTHTQNRNDDERRFMRDWWLA
jgi:hypothetical protein